jgi:hypothetical protein
MINCIISTVPKWRNWQTRWTQNPVGREARAGSIPAFGTMDIIESPPAKKSAFNDRKKQ